MKTTIDLPDDLAEAAKGLARQERTSLRDLVVSGLRAEISRRRDHATVDFHFPTYGGDGVQPGLDPAEVIARSYGLHP